MKKKNYNGFLYEQYKEKDIKNHYIDTIFCLEFTFIYLTRSSTST